MKVDAEGSEDGAEVGGPTAMEERKSEMKLRWTRARKQAPTGDPTASWT